MIKPNTPAPAGEEGLKPCPDCAHIWLMHNLIGCTMYLPEGDCPCTNRFEAAARPAVEAEIAAPVDDEGMEEARVEAPRCRLCGEDLEYKCDIAKYPFHHLYGHRSESSCGNIEYIARGKEREDDSRKAIQSLSAELKASKEREKAMLEVIEHYYYNAETADYQTAAEYIAKCCSVDRHQKKEGE